MRYHIKCSLLWMCLSFRSESRPGSAEVLFSEEMDTFPNDPFPFHSLHPIFTWVSWRLGGSLLFLPAVRGTVLSAPSFLEKITHVVAIQILPWLT